MCKQITLLCNFLISQWCRNLMDTGLLYTSTCFCPNEFHLLHRKEKWFLSNFEYGMFLGVFWTVLRFLKNGPKKGRGGGDFSEQLEIPCWWKGLTGKQAVRKATITRITILYYGGIQKCKRRPHQAPHLPNENKKPKLQFTKDPKDWTIDNRKNIGCSDKSWFVTFG